MGVFTSKVASPLLTPTPTTPRRNLLPELSTITPPLLNKNTPSPSQPKRNIDKELAKVADADTTNKFLEEELKSENKFITKEISNKNLNEKNYKISSEEDKMEELNYLMNKVGIQNKDLKRVRDEEASGNPVGRKKTRLNEDDDEEDGRKRKHSKRRKSKGKPKRKSKSKGTPKRKSTRRKLH